MSTRSSLASYLPQRFPYAATGYFMIQPGGAGEGGGGLRSPGWGIGKVIDRLGGSGGASRLWGLARTAASASARGAEALPRACCSVTGLRPSTGMRVYHSSDSR